MTKITTIPIRGWLPKYQHLRDQKIRAWLAHKLVFVGHFAPFALN